MPSIKAKTERGERNLQQKKHQKREEKIGFYCLWRVSEHQDQENCCGGNLDPTHVERVEKYYFIV